WPAHRAMLSPPVTPVQAAQKTTAPFGAVETTDDRWRRSELLVVLQVVELPGNFIRRVEAVGERGERHRRLLVEHVVHAERDLRVPRCLPVEGDVVVGRATHLVLGTGQDHAIRIDSGIVEEFAEAVVVVVERAYLVLARV